MFKRRYEILLPLKHNDGRTVDTELFQRTREELIEQFGAVSLVPESVRGVWVHEGQRYEDSLMKMVIDVEDIPEFRQFFVDFKATLLERFDQLEIYIASYSVDII